jgi:hypothetical protein
VPAVLSSGKIAANLIDPNPFMFTTRTDIDREMENMEPTPA